MNRLLVVMAIGAFAGCTCVETCREDKDCKSGRCAVAEGVCTFEPDSGTGGGAAGGRAGGTAGGGMTAGGTAGGGMTAGGGATGGGSTGGGMTGGGTGGGRPRLCNGGCTDVWAACIDDGDAGVCEPGVLSVTAPVDGGSFAAGTDVGVQVTLLTPRSGAPWPTAVSIPVATTWGPSVRADSGVATSVLGASDAGLGVVTFGWDAGPQNVERIVSFTSCNSVSCQPWQECVPTVTGGRCENLPLTVSVTMPANDSLATKSMTVPFQVTVVSADAGRLPAAVPVVGPGLDASVPRDSATASTYTLQLNLAAPDGLRTYVAGWDAGLPGLIATRSLTYDGTPPMVTVEVQPPVRQSFEQDSAAMNAWKKDEAALVAVRVTDTTSPIEPVTTAMVTAPGAGMATAAPGQCSMCVAPAVDGLSGCFCFRADLSRTPILAARGTATVTVTGVLDRLMNASLVASSPLFTVTRFKWARTLNGAAAGVQPVAVGDAGVVFAATRELANGRVVALSPAGSVLWDTSDAGIITAGPSVGASVWVGTQSGANIALTPMSLGSGAPQTGRCLFGSGGAFDGDLALVRARESGTIYESPVGVRSAEAQLRMGSPGCFTQAIGVSTGTPLVVARTATSTDIEVFANRGSTTSLTKQTFDEGWSANSSYSFTGYGNLVSLFTGPGFVGGGGFAPDNGLVLYAQNAVAVAVTSLAPSKAPVASPTMDQPYSPVSVGQGHIFGGTQGGALRRFVLSGGALTGARDEVMGLGDISKTTPVLGKGGLVYVVNAAGELAAVDLGGTVNAAVWRYSGLITAAANGIGQPALDVVRDAAGAPQCTRGLGVLYVPSVNLGVATVTAVIVDSPGLDPLAPWPKYQRDNRNSGFADANSPAACQ